MKIPFWIRSRVLGYLYHRTGVQYNSFGVPLVISKYLKPNKPISLIDLGANTGFFTSGIESVYGVRRGLLVEPQPAHAALLRTKFKAPRFDVAQCAIAAQPGLMDLEINETDATTSIIKTRRDNSDLAGLDVRVRERVTCELRTLDSLTESHALGSIDLLKIDVQGAEHLVIAGGANTLLATKFVWCEVSFRALYEGSSIFVDIYELMNAAGFGLVEVEPGYRNPEGELLQADALFARR